jgi:hypothetical protein
MGVSVRLSRAAIVAVVLVVLLAGCEFRGPVSNPPAASHPPAAQCARAKAAVREISLTTSPFTTVSTTSGLMSADMSVAGNSAVTGSLQSDLATLSAAALAVRAPLSGDLRLVAADYSAFRSAGNTMPASPQAVASAARTTMADVHKITATCGG